MRLFSLYIAKILVVLLLIMVSALPCYSRTYKEIYNLYEEKFRSPKDFEDKNFKNIELIRMDLDVAFYKSAEKRIKWQKEKGVKSQFTKDEIEFLEIQSLYKQSIYRSSSKISNSTKLNRYSFTTKKNNRLDARNQRA